jgi:hypothetical protein
LRKQWLALAGFAWSTIELSRAGTAIPDVAPFDEGTVQSTRGFRPASGEIRRRLMPGIGRRPVRSKQPRHFLDQTHVEAQPGTLLDGQRAYRLDAPTTLATALFLTAREVIVCGVGLPLVGKR